MRSALRRQLLHLAIDLPARTANPDDLGHGFDLPIRSSATPVADAALCADPAVSAALKAVNRT